MSTELRQLQELLTVQETAKILKVREFRVHDMVRTGELPAVHLGRQVRVDPAALSAFIEGGGKRLPGGWRREARS
jgi:excisionase family DNA binding protein